MRALRFNDRNRAYAMRLPKWRSASPLAMENPLISSKRTRLLAVRGRCLRVDRVPDVPVAAAIVRGGSGVRSATVGDGADVLSGAGNTATSRSSLFHTPASSNRPRLALFIESEVVALVSSLVDSTD